MAASMRGARERVLQTVCYEGVGIAVMTPVCSGLALLEPGRSAAMLAAVSLAVMAWSLIFNTVFDRLELGLTGCPASDRPHGRRLVHALIFEGTAAVATCPILVAFTDWSYAEALGADFVLSLLYAAYGYVFHWSYDRWRPVTDAARPGAGRAPGSPAPLAARSIAAPASAHACVRACSPYLPSMPMM
ncbi:MAG: PACE efflux transporter [Myxococcota bacterium]